jgi:proteasome lid subunit RPN8/RPN11
MSPADSRPDQAGVPLEIPGPILVEMIEHCRRDAPLEACGLLGGVPPRADAIYPLRNAAASETRYDADPADLIAAVRSMRGRGTQILAIYHSHPKWAPIPSATDLSENYYQDVPRIIVSLLAPEAEVRVWKLEPDRYEELPWRVVVDD